jgi:FkbM family methyltransferase
MTLDERYAVLDDVLAGKRRAVVYPAARMGRHAARRLAASGVQVVALGDRSASGQTLLDGLPLRSPAQVAEMHREDVILVASTMYDSAIVRDLTSRGCEHIIPVGYLNRRLPDVFTSREYSGSSEAVTASRSKIDTLSALLADELSCRVLMEKAEFYVDLDKRRLESIRSTTTIYFEPDIYPMSHHEVFVDGGAYIGDTFAEFTRRTNGRFRSYLALEPDEQSFAALKIAAASDDRVTAVRAALGERSTEGRLLSTHGVDARMMAEDEPGGDAVPIISLDGYLHEPPTFIKMDIEGSEAAALRGAAQVLLHGATALAVSVYHYPSDLWTIPLLLKQLMPSCRLFLRHYTDEVDDTVCYAVPA